MKAFTLSLALAGLLALGTPTLVRAQDNTTAAKTPSSASDNVTFHTVSAALPGKAQGFSTFSVNLSTGAYTVESGGIEDHFIELQSQGTLSASQLDSIKKSLDTAKAAGAPAELPGALVAGAPSFTLSWDQGGKSGSVSGPDNAKAAVEGQPASVKAVWKAVSPLLDGMQKMSSSLVKDHPYAPNVKTVETPKDDTKAPKSVDLGLLNSPGSEFMKAAEAKGLVSGGDLNLAPGQKVTFTSQRNQINGVVSMDSSSPDVTVTSKIVKAMVPGQDGNMATVEWTIAASPKATGSTSAEITATGDYMSRNDPNYNFKIGVSTKPAATSETVAHGDDGIAPPTKDGSNFAADAIKAAAAAAAKDGLTVEGGSGVDPRIVARGQDSGPRTGMGQILDKKMDDAKSGDTAKPEDR